MKKKFRIVSMLLTVVMLMSGFVTPVAASQRHGRGQERQSEQQVSACWGEMLRQAEAAVTSEQIAEAYRIMEETKQFFQPSAQNRSGRLI